MGQSGAAVIRSGRPRTRVAIDRLRGAAIPSQIVLERCEQRLIRAARDRTQHQLACALLSELAVRRVDAVTHCNERSAELIRGQHGIRERPYPDDRFGERDKADVMSNAVPTSCTPALSVHT
jgi:hypothetical protein